MKKKPFFVNGNDYPTKDGTCVRDYIHVSDLAEGHLSALNFLKKKEGCFKFNLGSGIGYSILEIIHSIEKYLKIKINYKFKKRRIGDPAKLFAEKNTKKKFIWKPKRSKLNYIIRDTWKWYERELKYKR